MPTTQNSITLNWTPATDNIGIAYYNVFLSVDGLNWDEGTNVGNVLQYTYEGLMPGTQYWFSNTAVDDAGNQSYRSNIVTDRTLYL